MLSFMQRTQKGVACLWCAKTRIFCRSGGCKPWLCCAQLLLQEQQKELSNAIEQRRGKHERCNPQGSADKSPCGVTLMKSNWVLQPCDYIWQFRQGCPMICTHLDHCLITYTTWQGKNKILSILDVLFVPGRFSNWYSEDELTTWNHSCNTDSHFLLSQPSILSLSSILPDSCDSRLSEHAWGQSLDNGGGNLTTCKSATPRVSQLRTMRLKTKLVNAGRSTKK